jgi:hypothetical protein
MEAKTCFKCGEEKARTEFYKHAAMGDGLLGKCKECTKADVRSHRAKNRERYNAYDRERAKGSAARKASQKALRERDEASGKARARRMTRLHIKRGNLTRKPCEVCGAEPADAHHDDYNHPLDVRWLCRSHHQRWHAENGPGRPVNGD